jgi:hypothetical protein
MKKPDFESMAHEWFLQELVGGEGCPSLAALLSSAYELGRAAGRSPSDGSRSSFRIRPPPVARRRDRCATR